MPAVNSACEMPDYIHHIEAGQSHPPSSDKSCISEGKKILFCTNWTEKYNVQISALYISSFFQQIKLIVLSMLSDLKNFIQSLEISYILILYYKQRQRGSIRRLTAFSADFSHLMLASMIPSRTWSLDRVLAFSTASLHLDIPWQTLISSSTQIKYNNINVLLHFDIIKHNNILQWYISLNLAIHEFTYILVTEGRERADYFIVLIFIPY